MSTITEHVPLNTRFELIQNTVRDWVNLPEFNDSQFETKLHKKVKRVLTNLIKLTNPSAAQEDISEYAEDTISNYISWLKRRNEHGAITWDELCERMKNDLQYSEFGIRVSRFGRVYWQIYFNYIIFENGLIKLCNADYDEDHEKSEAGTQIYANSYVSLTDDDISEIYMGKADLIYNCGIREVTIRYNNGEVVVLRFSDDN